jgi:Fe-Mn family superoxide dismutase
MNKREFLKKSALFSIGSIAAATMPAGTIASGMMGNGGKSGDETFKQPELGYAYDALEPHIDAMTMELHYSKHHAGYTAKFNAAVAEAGIGDKEIKEIFENVSKYPDAVRNNGGGYYNHKLFWRVMSPDGGGEPKGELLKGIEKSFGSFDSFKDKFSQTAATVFGSGWAWLIHSDGKLIVASTPNQDNPLMDIAAIKGTPLLLIDVWEHAYYLKYQNRRTDYIGAFWNVVNWDYIYEKYLKTIG